MNLQHHHNFGQQSKTSPRKPQKVPAWATLVALKNLEDVLRWKFLLSSQRCGSTFNIIQHCSTQHPTSSIESSIESSIYSILWFPFKAHSCHRVSTVFSPAWLRDQRKGASARQLASGLGNGWTWWDGGMLVFCSWKFMESDEIEFSKATLQLPQQPRCTCRVVKDWDLETELLRSRQSLSYVDPGNSGLQAFTFESRSAHCARKHAKTQTQKTQDTLTQHTQRCEISVI